MMRFLEKYVVFVIPIICLIFCLRIYENSVVSGIDVYIEIGESMLADGSNGGWSGLSDDGKRVVRRILSGGVKFGEGSRFLVLLLLGVIMFISVVMSVLHSIFQILNEKERSKIRQEIKDTHDF